MNVILLGFMGAGKSSIGRKLALRLGYRFIDTDSYIEREQGENIAILFEKYGESYFRKLETNLLERLVGTQNTVISTGGGVLVDPDNIKIIKTIGRSVHLNIGLKEIIPRLKRNMKKRPLLKTGSPLETIEELFHTRRSLYEQADIAVRVTSFRKAVVVSKIIKALLRGC